MNASLARDRSSEWSIILTDFACGSRLLVAKDERSLSNNRPSGSEELLDVGHRRDSLGPLSTRRVGTRSDELGTPRSPCTDDRSPGPASAAVQVGDRLPPEARLIGCSKKVDADDDYNGFVTGCKPYSQKCSARLRFVALPGRGNARIVRCPWAQQKAEAEWRSLLSEAVLMDLNSSLLDSWGPSSASGGSMDLVVGS
jgi:hypothetical protein